MKPTIARCGAYLFIIVSIGFSSPKDHPARRPYFDGLMVEALAKANAKAAGLVVGDRLLEWQLKGKHGRFNTVIDFLALQEEASQTEPVVFRGIRKGSPIRWRLQTGDWGIFVGPFAPDPQLQTRLRTQGWEKIVGTADNDPPTWIRLSLFVYTAQRLMMEHHWIEMDRAYLSALNISVRASPRTRGRVLYLWANALYDRGEQARARSRYVDALVEFERASPTLAAALINARLGLICNQSSEFMLGRKYYLKSIQLATAIAPQSPELADFWCGLGNIEGKLGNIPQAEFCYRKAVRLLQSANGSRTFALAANLNNLGLVVGRRGDLSESERYLREGLSIRRHLGNSERETATSLINLANLALLRCDFSGASKEYLEAVQLLDKVAPYGTEMAAGLLGLANLSIARRDFAQANWYLSKALPMYERLAPKSYGYATVLFDLGIVSQESGRLDEAKTFYQRSRRLSQIFSQLDIAMCLAGLGTVEQKKGHLHAAARYYRQSLIIAQKDVGGRRLSAHDFANLADLAQKTGRVHEAMWLYKRALSVFVKLGRGQGTADALAGLASLHVQSRQWSVAAKLYEQSLDAMDFEALHFGASYDLESLFRSKNREHYANYVRVLEESGNSRRAFEVLERGTANGFLQLMTQINVKANIDNALGINSQRLRDELAAKYSQRLSASSVSRIDQEIDSLLNQYKAVEEQLRQQSPEYSALARPTPFGIEDIQRQLDDNSLLLSYSLGEQSYLFVIGKASFSSVAIGKGEEIDRVAKEVHGLLTDWQRDPKNDAKARYALAARRLADIALSPLGSFGNKKLIIVADGALRLTSFAALPVPFVRDTFVPLATQSQVTYLPSASAIGLLRERARKRKPLPGSVAIFADPVFDRLDSRVKGKALNSAPSVQGVSVHSQTGWPLASLPMSRIEAQNILDVVRPRETGFAAFDFAASRSLALSESLQDYRVIHFATHAVLNDDQPALSALVLSLVDKQGDPVNGLLTLEDIYNLRVSADLVVLSACDTALGAEVAGEGLIGLTRGWMYAGATRVVATLWSVNDAATSEFMRHFYEEMKTSSPANALRRAQITMARSNTWSDPYYWAGFVLEGEWN